MKNLINQHLVSIIMPAYNVGNYIDTSIQSVVCQTYSNWELIITDDGSKDKTWTIMQEWALKDSRIRIFKNDTNRGLGYTTNNCLQYSTGSFIAKLDSDDIALPKWIETRMNYLIENPKLIAVTGSRIVIDEKGKHIKTLFEGSSPIAVKWRLIFGNPVVHPGIVFRKKVGMQYNATLKYFEDWELWTTINSFGDIEIINDHTIKYRIHSNNTSSRLGDKFNDFMPIIEEIVTKQTLKYFNEKVETSLIWYCYRDRQKFSGDAEKISIAIAEVFRLFNMFLLQNKSAISERIKEELEIALWDEICHLMRLGKSSNKLLWKIYTSFPINFASLLFNQQGRVLLAKLLFLVCKKVICNKYFYPCSGNASDS